MADFPAPGFTGSPLVRLDIERDQEEYFAAARANPKSRLLRLESLAPIVEDTLSLTVDLQAPVVQQVRDTAFRLEERMLDELRFERLLDDERRATQRQIEIASFDYRSR